MKSLDKNNNSKKKVMVIFKNEFSRRLAHKLDEVERLTELVYSK